uniref:Copia protein n=1 Tax=Tanacetum cinerariifolium TaxID=118510 RepID=A0A6L2MPW5_TANCI|nr:copia protein [Tanacetum cinerariifolium]
MPSIEGYYEENVDHMEQTDKLVQATMDSLDKTTAFDKSALHAPIPEQASSQSLGRKRNHVELEPEIKVPRLECNRDLPKCVPFVNNVVIEEPEYGIFFIAVLGDQAFQRWNDIHKVEVDSLVSYLMMASTIKTLENARFCMKLKKLIAKHPDQENI